MSDINEAVYALAARVKELKPVIETEEATKTAFIVPFIQNILGYDATDPREVIPEYTADVGIKKGEKVDYAIKSGDSFRFLIECKKIGEPLSIEHANQLIRYFNVTDTEFAILTNGEVYQFYTQLESTNRMDQTPFMVLDLGNIDARVFPHLAMCTKSKFDASTIIQTAEVLKYVNEARKVLAAQFKQPDEDWVKQIAVRISSRRMTAQALEFFVGVVTTAQTQFLNDEVNRRLQSAQAIEEAPEKPIEAEELSSDAGGSQDSDGIVTTPEEIEAHMIIRAIGCTEVPAEDIVMRDAKSYCAILYKDNNRKSIARLRFTPSMMRLSILDEDKQETHYELSSVSDIYSYADAIRERIRFLRDGKNSDASS